MSGKKEGSIMSGIKSSFKRNKEREREGNLSIGTLIEVQFIGGERMKFVIAERGMGNPPEGSISYDTPLVRALSNAKEGEEVSYEIKEKEFKVVLLKRINSS